MNRRGFLQSLIGAAVAAQQLDIEKLLWVPGEKTIFIPPPSITLQQYMLHNKDCLKYIVGVLRQRNEILDEMLWGPGLAARQPRLVRMLSAGAQNKI